MRIHPGQSLLATALVAAASIAGPLRAQTPTVPANYHGPTVVGFCFYTQAAAAKAQPSAVSYAGPITISNYFRFDAERAFQQFAATRSQNKAANITCHWASQQQYAAAADKGFHAKDSAGHAIAATQTGWHYTPGSGGMTTAATNTATASRSSAASSTAASGAAAATSPVSTNPATSITQSANNSKQAITASGASSVTDTMGSATTSITGAMQGGVGRLFHKKQAAATTPAAAATPADAAAPTDPAISTPGGATTNPADNVISSPGDASPGFATIPATPGDTAADAGGGSFVFCHLKAAGAVYVSDIFPSSDANDAGAQTAFWKQVGHQYKLASIPFRDNVACVRSPAEQQATAARQTLMSSSAGKTIDTAWTYMGDPTK